MLLNKETYIKSASELVQVDKFRSWMLAANVAVMCLILIISVMAYFSTTLDDEKLS